MKNKTLQLIIGLLVLCLVTINAQELAVFGCRASLKGDTLKLENNLVSRTYHWNNGHLRTLCLTNESTGEGFSFMAQSPDLGFPGLEIMPGGSLRMNRVEGDGRLVNHLQVEVISNFKNLAVKRIFRIYPNSRAIACDLYIKGTYPGNWTSYDEKGRASTPLFETVSPRGVHWRIKTIEFTDRTDDNNNLVNRSEHLVFTRPGLSVGNLAFIAPEFGDQTLFILKEAPDKLAQFGYPGFDFIDFQSQDHHLQLSLAGMNISPGDLQPEKWIRCSGFATGICSKGEFEEMNALRSYQEQLREWDAGRDEMILMNTWGDRGQDARISEAFCIQEIGMAQQLGLTHFQIDDGWQTGITANSALSGGSLDDIWQNKKYWEVHPDRFPRGLGPVVSEASKKNIKLGLWFNPSHDDHYANWKKDAAVILNYYHQFNIQTFKIDGVIINSKQAELNFRSFLDTLMIASGNEIIINLDVTGLARRPGYHYFNEYGNIFLENRYTDWGNYYPHWTLRNLWMLSAYMPSKKLQIEFLNPKRNMGKYMSGDVLAPGAIPFDYQFAIAMMAQPLAWFEGSNLSKDEVRLGTLISQYRDAMIEVHRGRIFPIGAEPSGKSWTGFQSIVTGGSGYMLVFREFNDNSASQIPICLTPGRSVVFSSILGNGEDFTSQVSKEATVEFRLPEKWDFVLYRYQILE